MNKKKKQHKRSSIDTGRPGQKQQQQWHLPKIKGKNRKDKKGKGFLLNASLIYFS
jgi:hypothetical protein